MLNFRCSAGYDVDAKIAVYSFVWIDAGFPLCGSAEIYLANGQQHPSKPQTIRHLFLPLLTSGSVQCWTKAAEECIAIDNNIKEQNAAMIYWNHGQEKWNYALSSDKKLIKREMKNLIMLIKSGKIIHVSRGASVEVKGAHLYPVEMEVENVQCGAYFVVAKRGLIDDLSMTPYFFINGKQCRQCR